MSTQETLALADLGHQTATAAPQLVLADAAVVHHLLTRADAAITPSSSPAHAAARLCAGVFHPQWCGGRVDELQPALWGLQLPTGAVVTLVEAERWERYPRKTSCVMQSAARCMAWLQAAEK